MFTVYKMTNSVNGKIYVGQTSQNLLKYLRSDVTRSLLNNGDRKPKLYPAIRKYGESAFSIERLATAPDKIYADKLEIFFIRILKSQDREVGYNIANGGGGSFGYTRVFTAEHIEKIRASSTGRKHRQETLEKMSKSSKGRPKTQEHKDKLSKAKMGRSLGPFSDDHKKKIADALRGKKRPPEVVEKVRQALLLRAQLKREAECQS
jgi:group I intron endonuclease